MIDLKNAPPAEKILATLVNLYAEQCNVKISYEIINAEKEENDVLHR